MVGDVEPMITLRRAGQTVTMKADLWQTLQALALQEGWRPIGTVTDAAGARRTFYGAGQSVMARDARALANALERLVNSKKADDVKFDLAPLVQLVNFLRRGAFEIGEAPAR